MELGVVTSLSVTGLGVIVSVADADFVGSAWAVAMMVAVPAPTPRTRPALETAATAVLDELQFTAVDALPVVATVAVRSSESATRSEPVAGVTVTDLTLAASVTVDRKSVV